MLQYDAFGNILESTGSVSNNIKYAGYQYDEETGYYYLKARMYDPITARFLQEDTFTGKPNDPLSLNLYTYVKNNPLIYTDPTGHMINENLYGHKRGTGRVVTQEEIKERHDRIRKQGYENLLMDLLEANGKTIVNYEDFPANMTETDIINRILEEYWNSEGAGDNPDMDFAMLLLEAKAHGSINMMEVENGVVKDIPVGKGLALYHLAADSLVYDPTHIDMDAMDQFETLTGEQDARYSLSYENVKKLIGIYYNNPFFDINKWCWEHREACKGIIGILNGVTIGIYGNNSMKGWNQWYGASVNGVGADMADAQVASGNTSGSTQKILQGYADNINQTIPGQGPVAGTYKHTAFKQAVDALGNPNLATERTFLNGQEVSYGTKGGIRVDVIEYNANGTVIVYDLKTGSAVLTQNRITQIQNAVNPANPSSVTVVQIK